MGKREVDQVRGGTRVGWGLGSTLDEGIGPYQKRVDGVTRVGVTNELTLIRNVTPEDTDEMNFRGERNRKNWRKKRNKRSIVGSTLIVS